MVITFSDVSSKIIAGSENSHQQLRCIISQCFVSKGGTKLGWYSISKQTTLYEYHLVVNHVYRQSILGRDVEIMAASASPAAVFSYYMFPECEVVLIYFPASESFQMRES